MARHDPFVSIAQMRDHAREAVEMAAGKTRHDLDEDRQFQLALIHLIEIVGEAANRVPADVQQSHATVPWQEAIAFRHKMAHGYDIVDLDVVWGTIHESLPQLISALDKILGNDG